MARKNLNFSFIWDTENSFNALNAKPVVLKVYVAFEFRTVVKQGYGIIIEFLGNLVFDSFNMAWRWRPNIYKANKYVLNLNFKFS